jgi:hypothetical protein
MLNTFRSQGFFDSSSSSFFVGDSVAFAFPFSRAAGTMGSASPKAGGGETSIGAPMSMSMVGVSNEKTGGWKRSCCEGPRNAPNTKSRYVASKCAETASIRDMTSPHSAWVIGKSRSWLANVFAKLPRFACGNTRLSRQIINDRSRDLPMAVVGPETTS